MQNSFSMNKSTENTQENVQGSYKERLKLSQTEKKILLSLADNDTLTIKELTSIIKDKSFESVRNYVRQLKNNYSVTPDRQKKANGPCIKQRLNTPPKIIKCC